MSSVVLWRLPLRDARRRSRRIEAATAAKTEEFMEAQSRVDTAAARAERAAVILMTRSDDLARSVAQRS